MERAVAAYRQQPPQPDGPAAAMPTTGVSGRVLHMTAAAARTDPLDPAPHVLAAEMVGSLGRWDLSDTAWGEAMACRPGSAALAYGRATAWAEALRRVAGAAGIGEDQRLLMRKQALRLSAEAAALYPTGRHEHWLLARLLDDDGQSGPAAGEYARVLALDDALAPWHAASRLTDAQRGEIQRRLAELAAPASRP
jgi:hypothetical protein